MSPFSVDYLDRETQSLFTATATSGNVPIKTLLTGENDKWTSTSGGNTAEIIVSLKEGHLMQFDLYLKNALFVRLLISNGTSEHFILKSIVSSFENFS